MNYVLVLQQVCLLGSSSCHPSVRESTVDWSLISVVLIKDQILNTSMQRWKEKHPPSPIIEIHFKCICGRVQNVQHDSMTGCEMYVCWLKIECENMRLMCVLSK